MDLQIIAHNVRRLRMGKGLSQGGLAEAAGLSLPATKSIELAKSEPRMKTLMAMAKALGVQPQELLLPVRELRTVRFRSAKRMKNRENVLADVARRLDDFNYLEKILGQKIPYCFYRIRNQCSRDQVVKAADLCRNELKLKPSEPIYDICGLLERAGVKVIPRQVASEGFFGLSIGEEDGGPAILVNIWDLITVERRIFSAAHELGHLILHAHAYDVTKTEENKEEEQEADRFAGHFLMPNEGFRKEWGDASGLHGVDRVIKVKRIFRVSYKAVLARLVELGAADKTVWSHFNTAYQQRFNRKLSFKEEPMGIDSAEPFRLQTFDFYEDRYSRLTREAIETGKISLSRGAEMLQIGIEEMRDILQNWKAAI